jgi:hypothetical protein
VAGALLVPDEDVAQLRGVEERVVGREDRAARDAEHRVDADVLQGADQRLGSRHLFGRHDLRFPWGVVGGSPGNKKPPPP